MAPMVLRPALVAVRVLAELPHEAEAGEARLLLGLAQGRGLGGLARRYPNERLVVVTHGVVINAVLTECSGGTLRWGTANLHTACVRVLHLRGGTWEIESHNTIAHLMDALPTA